MQDFKAETSIPEFGQTGGAVVNMVIKSGTNNFDGTAYYFLRNSSLNANNWFTNRAGRERPYYHRDQVGGVFGGPLIKNKTFFFVTYEYTESKNPLSSTRTVPTLLQRQGDFSETKNAAGQVMTIYNPFDTFVNAQGNLERRPFAGNRIPSSMLDPIALKALSYFPLPNTASTSTRTPTMVRQGYPRMSIASISGRPQLSGLRLTAVQLRYKNALRTLRSWARVPAQQRNIVGSPIPSTSSTGRRVPALGRVRYGLTKQLPGTPMRLRSPLVSQVH